MVETVVTFCLFYSLNCLFLIFSFNFFLKFLVLFFPPFSSSNEWVSWKSCKRSGAPMFTLPFQLWVKIVHACPAPITSWRDCGKTKISKMHNSNNTLSMLRFLPGQAIWVITPITRMAMPITFSTNPHAWGIPIVV